MSLFGKKLECQACGMKFVSETELRQHGAVHMAPKPRAAPQGPSCAACGISFGTSDELKAHAREGHGV